MTPKVLKWNRNSVIKYKYILKVVKSGHCLNDYFNKLTDQDCVIDPDLKQMKKKF